MLAAEEPSADLALLEVRTISRVARSQYCSLYSLVLQHTMCLLLFALVALAPQANMHLSCVTLRHW